MKNQILNLSYAAIFTILIIFGVFLVSGSFVSAQMTPEEIDAQIQSLSQQISDLQVQLRELRVLRAQTGTSVPASSRGISRSDRFNRALGVGATGTDVTSLQEFLSQFSDLYPERLVTGFFGPLTEKAVRKFQKKYGIVSSGDADSTGFGFVGPKTRAMLNDLEDSESDSDENMPPGMMEGYDDDDEYEDMDDDEYEDMDDDEYEDMDDYNYQGNMTDGTASNTTTPQTDTTSPAITITSHNNGNTVSGNIMLQAGVTDNVRVAYVEFSIGGLLLKTDTNAPYSVNIDTTSYSDGDYTVDVVGTDASGNTAWDSVTLTIDNTSTPPQTGGGITAAEVATHNNSNDCWLIISGKAYDVTQYIPFHPGGQSDITNNCGTDSTTLFTSDAGQGHRHDNSAHNLLNNYYVGDI